MQRQRMACGTKTEDPLVLAVQLFSLSGVTIRNRHDSITELGRRREKRLVAEAFATRVS